MSSTKTEPPLDAYKGDGPYIFISYSHRDCAAVFHELKRISSWGINIWYDEGIDPGNEWPVEIAKAITKCSLFVYFVSPTAIASVNCRKEVYFASSQDKPFISIHLVETKIVEIDEGLALTIGCLQAILKHQMQDDSYERKLKGTLESLLNLTASPLIDRQRYEWSRSLWIGLFAAFMLIVAICGVGYYRGMFVSKEKQEVVTAPSIAHQKIDQSTPQNVLVVKVPIDGQAWTNSLGLKFVPAGTSGVLFCIYDVRVQDYQAFVNSISYDMSGGIYVQTFKKVANGGTGFKFDLDTTASWRDPGFKQEPTEPVVGVNWNDAQAFCRWLTDKERSAGVLSPNQSYRLPSDQEWSAAVGDTKFPWGNTWPPLPSTANYADRALAKSVPSPGQGTVWDTVPGDDGYFHTSPVGTFQANQYGLYDMGGNVWQWIDDWYVTTMNSDEVKKAIPDSANDGGGRTYKVLRGASWVNSSPAYLQSRCRNSDYPTYRASDYGFRIVLVTQ